MKNGTLSARCDEPPQPPTVSQDVGLRCQMAAADYFDQNDNHSLAFNSLRLGAKKKKKMKRKEKRPIFQVRVLLGIGRVLIEMQTE